MAAKDRIAELGAKITQSGANFSTDVIKVSAGGSQVSVSVLLMPDRTTETRQRVDTFGRDNVISCMIQVPAAVSVAFSDAWIINGSHWATTSIGEDIGNGLIQVEVTKRVGEKIAAFRRLS